MYTYRDLVVDGAYFIKTKNVRKPGYGPVYLEDVYKSWSTEKQRAYNYCRHLYDELWGTCFTITAHNTFSFAVAFYFFHPATGEECIAYITKDYNRYCPTSEL